jgi:hypothetical protein
MSDANHSIYDLLIVGGEINGAEIGRGKGDLAAGPGVGIGKERGANSAFSRTSAYDPKRTYGPDSW